MPRKKFDLTSFRKKIVKLLNDTIGNPDYPSINDRMQYWNERKKHLIPRGYMYVFDLKKDRCVLAHGMSFLGFENDQLLLSDQLIEIVHDNHIQLCSYQAYKVHELMLSFRRDVIGFDYFSGGYRAVRDAKGVYWLTYYTSEIFQYDENGLPYSYLTWYHILSPYKGQPMDFQFFHKDGKTNHEPLMKIKSKVRDIRDEQLHYLGFTRTQLDVLNLYSLDKSVKEVAETLMIKKRSVDKHNINIIAVAKKAFPANEFRTYKDVVNYLRMQGLI